jgi:hypothetical protein
MDFGGKNGVGKLRWERVAGGLAHANAMDLLFGCLTNGLCLLQGQPPYSEAPRRVRHGLWKEKGLARPQRDERDLERQLPFVNPIISVARISADNGRI